MTTHLSTRLAWHDRGWDGHICDAPHLNSSCIIHQHIRDTREDDLERKYAGVPLNELQGWYPPCSRDPGAYSDSGFVVTHRDPLDFRSLPSVDEEIPPYTCCPTPYRWMREEFFQDVCDAEDLSIRGSDNSGKNMGWVFEPDRQRILLEHFWGKLEKQKSLIFYYCNHGNPLNENVARVIVGVGRIAEIGPPLFFGTTKEYPDLYPIWSRHITQDYPIQGVRIPYQEYLRADKSTDNILCIVPRSNLLAFSYVGEHVSDDVAVAILERVIQSVEMVKNEAVVPGNWDDRLNWLNDVLAETWSGRGPFPGIGSVLQYLRFAKGTAYHRTILAPMVKNGENPWEYVLAILEGRLDPEDGPYESGLLIARKRWAMLRSRQDLLSKLTRFELSPDQVERIADPDMRSKSGIQADEKQLVANPYIITESDLGYKNSHPIALETIDHGMRPEGDSRLFETEDEVSQDDSRRVRATAKAALKEAAENGDTVLPFPALLDKISKRFPERRICRPDREVFVAEGDFHREVLWTAFDDEPQLVALKHLRSLEEYAASVIRRRAKKTNKEAESSINWRQALIGTFGEPKSNRDEAAFVGEVGALEALFSRRISVLTGGAGTGKTSVLKVFLNELDTMEGRQPVVLLAPTGKARVRLSTMTKRNAMTIHQFLLKQGWFMPESFALKEESNSQGFKATTVVIDECSMVPMDLFGTMLRALDMGPLTRLILVGDPNQLPPIGPGRPFVDIIEWLKEEHPECLVSLDVCMRTDEEHGYGGESVALTLADGYRASAVSPADDEVIARLAKGNGSGDLEVDYWTDHDELLVKLRGRMKTLLGIADKDYKAFNSSLGIDTKNWQQSEAWQILAPTRTQHFGTDDLNRLIQLEYRGGLIFNSQKSYSKMPRPFGEQEIVANDKVIQIVNRSINGWPRGTGLDYVANGEIGIVRNTSWRQGGSDLLDVVFSTQIDVSYRYYRSQVDENLELAYALTVHKAQGSDFDVVFLIVPQSASTLSRELIYTGLTRFRKKLVLLIEKDIQPLLKLRSPDCSDTCSRNTQMFSLALRPSDVYRPHLAALIHRTKRGVAVRSKSEVIIADILGDLEISYEYEAPLYSKSDPDDFRLPDFTVSFEGDIFYWEHLGMLSVPGYREAWERKKQWYQENGRWEQLIISEDGPDGSIDAQQIERIAKERILAE